MIRRSSALVFSCFVCGCSSSGLEEGPSDAGSPTQEAWSPVQPEGHKPETDAGYLVSNGGVVAPRDRFITRVVSFTPGACAGFGASKMPDIVFGPPVGAGATRGGLDVVSLGTGGELVVSFEPNAIVDGDGPDFMVFENAFFAGGDPKFPHADIAEISVSDDGASWKTYACTATRHPYGSCAGWHPVFSAPDNDISPFDAEKAGGEAFDLAAVGLSRARFVKIRDRGGAACTGADNNGFDLDAISIVHGTK